MESNPSQSNAKISPEPGLEQTSGDSFIDEYLNNMEGSDIDRDSTLDEPFAFLESAESEVLVSKEPLFPIDGSKTSSPKRTSNYKSQKGHIEKTTGSRSSNEVGTDTTCLQNDSIETDGTNMQNPCMVSDPNYFTKSKLDLMISCSPKKSDKELHSTNIPKHSPKNLQPGVHVDKPFDISWLSSSKQPFNIADMSFDQFQLLYYQHLFKNTKDEPSEHQKTSTCRKSDEISSACKQDTQPTKSESNNVSKSAIAPSTDKSYKASAIKINHTESDKKAPVDQCKKTTGFAHECSRCDEVFRSRLELTVHDKHVHAVDWDSDLQCHTCNKKFSSKYYLSQHELTHKGNLPFSCDLCDKRFLCKGTLETHVILLHTNDRPYKCDECGAAFKLKKILMRHVSTHTKEAPYKCSCCDKRFSRRGSLNRHELIHTGVKPFQCKVCEKRFTQKSTLTLHMMGHTNERPYQCLKCNKKFRKKSHLTRHDSVHSGKKQYYECKVCNKCFAEKYCLVEHEKTHAGDLLGLANTPRT